MSDPLLRLQRAQDLGFGVDFDPEEVTLLWSCFFNLEARLKKELKAHEETVFAGFKQAQESSGLMLKAALAGVFLGSQQQRDIP